MSKQWRHAVVGVGVVGEWHVRVVPQIANSSLVALCDLDPAKCEAALEKNKISGVKVYSDQAKMLADEKLDVIHVATPSGDHRGPVLQALTAGVNVICEKPLEIQLDRIDEMNAVAKKSGAKLAGIFQNRWNPANRAIKQAAGEGRFGTVAFAGAYTPWYRTDQYYRDGGWRGTWKLDGGGAIMNQSVHAVDLLQWIAGPVKTVSAYGSSRIHPEIEVEDTLACSLQFQSGAYGVIMGTTAMYPGGHVRIEIGGADGMATSEDGLKIFKFRQHRESDQQIVDAATRKPDIAAGSSSINQGQDRHRLNIESILRAWERDEEAETNGVEARKAVAIVLAMYESARKGGAPVQVR